MRKILRCAVLTSALLGAAIGFSWMGHMNVTEAYSYDLDGAYDWSTNYPEHLYGDQRLLLAYTHHGNAYYVDMSSAYCVRQEGQVYYLGGTVYFYNMEHGMIENLGEFRYKYDLAQGYIYGSRKDKNTQEYTYNDNPYWTAKSTDEATKALMSLSKLIWKAYSGEEWIN